MIVFGVNGDGLVMIFVILDFEVIKFYLFVIMVFDGGLFKFIINVIVSIQVIGVNEFLFVFSNLIYVVSYLEVS